MKKVLSLIILTAILSIAIPAFPQGSWINDAKNVTGFAGENQGRMIVFTCAVDSVDTLTSKTFSLAKYDGCKELYSALDSIYILSSEMSIEVPYAYIANSILGSPKVTTYIQGSYDQLNWFNVDTLCTNLTSESLTKGTAQLFRHHVPYYRAVVYGVAQNRRDTVFDFRFYFYWDLDQRDW